MTRADRLAMARCLQNAARELQVTYREPSVRRVQDKVICAEIAQLRAWAKMLREDK